MILEADVLVECDECGDEATFTIEEQSDTRLHSALKSDGWERVTNHRLGPQMLCPDCVQKLEDEE